MVRTHNKPSPPGWLYRLLFPRWRPRAQLRPRVHATRGERARIRWLGTAGHIIEAGGATLLIDPFLSRPSARQLLAPLEPNQEAIAARVPARVDAILCGHSHFDHLLDAPAIARSTGALLVGSASTCNIARASGVPAAQLVEIAPQGGSVTVGAATIRFIPSLHGRALFHRVPFPGVVATPPTLPIPAWRYRMGGAFGIYIEAPGLRLYHNGSADLVDAALAGVRADVLLVGLAGRRATRDYLARLCDALAPRLIVPTHHDAFFAPLDGGVRLLPGIDLDGFVADAHAHAPAARIITPDYDEVIAVPDDASASALVDSHLSIVPPTLPTVPASNGHARRS
jgi:L-ascorbate metabolism protein UlaG (beta-lactamase superfamily)